MWINLHDENPDDEKSSRFLINCKKKGRETLDNKNYKNNVFINPPPLIENTIPNIAGITDIKTSTNSNTSTKTSNQRENSITEKSKELALVIGDGMIKDANGYLVSGLWNRKYIVKIRPFLSTKTSDME